MYCHQDFLDKLAERRNEPLAKRASLLMQRMAVDIARLHYKATAGVNRGWRRSRLGGSYGSHFYAWWAPSGAAPLKSDDGFDAPSDAVFLRDIRHHDDHAPLSPGTFTSDYLPLSVSDLRGEEYAPEPFTPPQTRFVRARTTVRTLRGHPGSGKTTALLHAADASNAERVFYLTFSPDLAALARDYFDRFCSAERSFTVATFPDFVRGLQAWKPAADNAGGRQRFQRDLVNFQRSLGPWAGKTDALYDELHAHLAGAALPEACGRFPAAERMLLPEKAYRAIRDRDLGPLTEGVLEAARRLQKISDEPLADRYFPDLAVAWRAAQALIGKAGALLRQIPDYGCIAVDEVQDLTPIEAFTVIALARRVALNGSRCVLLLSGDEAQTVRPTDFEWGWLNQMLHVTLSQPQDFKLPVNLRSPRRIAEVVNRTWDLYQYLEKRDRPSGSGSTEIADDAPDQILYTALARAELTPLLRELGTHEGMALVAFDKAALPAEVHPIVLTPAEAKGLDFHTVCVINGGRLLETIVERRLNSTADQLTRRVAIDQLRVALSRPTERLIWVDAEPNPAAVKEAGMLLDPVHGVGCPPISVDALRACLDEGELDVDERIQRCQSDARQYVSVKPDLAWSRANQAVALLGTDIEQTAVTDVQTRTAAYLSLSEISFQLACRGKKLSPELGQHDLYEHAATAAGRAGRNGLANTIRSVGRVASVSGGDQLNPIAWAIQSISEQREELPAWFFVEMTSRAESWLLELEKHIEAADNAVTAHKILPPFLDAMGLADAGARKQKLNQRVVQVLMKQRKYRMALTVLESQPDANPKLIAECCEETGDFGRAAAAYLKMGDRDKALRAFRSAADFTSALDLVKQIEDHPAKKSLEWLAEIDKLVNRRPENFGRVMLPAEKKLLESVLERGLGIQRKKPAARKKAAPGAATRQGTAAKKKAPAPRVKSK